MTINNVAGTGITVTLTSTTTFSIPAILTNFPDDSDPLDVGDVTIGDTAMGLNGNLMTWRMPPVYEVTLSVIPNTIDDTLLTHLANMNSAGRFKFSTEDNITLSAFYPATGTLVTYTDGVIVGAPGGTSTDGSGRQKSKSFIFRFSTKR
jgi:hypothetical protein